MVTEVIKAYRANGVPVNQPKHVADTYLHILATGVKSEAFYVSGGKTYEIEKRMDDNKAQWLGQSVFEELNAGQAALGAVSISEWY
jgi:hypothetical protein